MQSRLEKIMKNKVMKKRNNSQVQKLKIFSRAEKIIIRLVKTFIT